MLKPITVVPVVKNTERVTNEELLKLANERYAASDTSCRVVEKREGRGYLVAVYVIGYTSMACARARTVLAARREVKRQLLRQRYVRQRDLWKAITNELKTAHSYMLVDVWRALYPNDQVIPVSSIACESPE